MGFDAITAALGTQARRDILVELLDHNPVEHREPVAENDSGPTDELEVELVHTHLPKLEAMGYIVWKKDHGTIVKGPQWDEIKPVIQLLSDNRDQIPPDTFHRPK